MAVIVSTDQPQELLNAINTAIKKGHVTTWSVDSDGDFTHTPEQWRYKAWFTARISGESLVFNIVPRKNTAISSQVYGVYHGRFIEMLLVHFDLKFTRAAGTAMPTANDRIGRSS